MSARSAANYNPTTQELNAAIDDVIKRVSCCSGAVRWRGRMKNVLTSNRMEGGSAVKEQLIR